MTTTTSGLFDLVNYATSYVCAYRAYIQDSGPVKTLAKVNRQSIWFTKRVASDNVREKNHRSAMRAFGQGEYLRLRKNTVAIQFITLMPSVEFEEDLQARPVRISVLFPIQRPFRFWGADI